MLWIALHLPALSLEAWAATLGPDQASRPLALMHGHQVLLADAQAAALGVRPGMKRATAQALAPALLLGQACAQRDTLALRAVAQVALVFSPSVAWATPGGATGAAASRPGHAARGQRDDGLAEALQGTPPNPAASPALVGVQLEVYSCLRYHGGLARLLQRLLHSLAPLGHRLQWATAPTATAAALLAAARSGDSARLGAEAAATARPSPSPSTSPSPSRAAAAAATFSSPSLAELPALLNPLPLDLLGLSTAQAEAAQAMGLRTLGDLAGLPRAGLARRLGPELLAQIDRARGQQAEAHTWLRLPEQFASRIELMARADTSDQVLAGARLLLARLVAWARARQQLVRQFTLVMHHEPRHRADSDTPARSTLLVAPAQPTDEHGHLHLLLAERLGRLPLAAPALELSLLCDALQTGQAPNGELFASRQSRHEGLSRLVERLQARLGADQVLRVQAVADHRPEHASRWPPARPGASAALGGLGADTLHPPSAATGGAATPGPARQALPAQPLWLLPQPHALALHSTGLQLDGQPLQLLAGPERLETGWWDGATAQRDYFIARTPDGALVWLYRTRVLDDALAEGGRGWFLQGWFG